MKKMIHLFILALLMLISCSQQTETDIEVYKNEIIKAEQDFASMAAKEGVPMAFARFSADSAVLLRGSKLIKGKKEMIPYMEKQFNESMKLSWEADFVDVSRSGDLGYTYGRYTFSYADSTGAINESSGYFHTVWKKQSDGQWKFVWD